VNITVPFLLATVVYVNVNVFSVAVQPTVAALNVTNHAVVIVISLHARDVLAIHTASLHVNVIVQDSHAFIYFLLGSHHVHTGFELSFAFAVKVVFCVRVTVVLAFVKLAGVFHAFTIHHENTYPLAVFGVAVIVGVAPYLYTHLHVTSGHHVNCALHTDGFHVPFTRSYIPYTHALFLHGI
jgi:hypothetical protein